MPDAAATARPRIGITAWRRPLPTPLGERTDLYTLGVEYVYAVQAAGGLAVLLPHDDDPDATLDAIDGLLLSGGGDVDPSSYGAANTASKDENVAADAWELALVRAAQRRGLPVLGICRGMQIMAVAAGGRLVQEIGGTCEHPDMAPMGPTEVLEARHDVQFAPASALGMLYQATTRRVNTIHHQAVDDAGTLAVTATSPGGVIEAIESRGAWCGIGVQWHPEKLSAAEAEAERPLFAHFIERARAYARER